ncbi:hypothetical protein LZ198_38510 [Myxococcus sp. K15C18031901]|uniref:SitI3 family protein n=1 Tax=Myxococcus dinghuensis TaxID=2906761 RepID=UPI0020A7DC71|nr:SitI3 family protein [Myxococcus dinghuensis]MCP3104775.1 hypothetical protein [Myxococcus dinghuensis]
MSLDYNFRIDTALTPERVLAVACDALGLKQPDASRPGDDAAIPGPGFLFAAGPVARESQTLMKEELGISPSVDLQFWVDAEQRHTAITVLLRGVLTILRQESGDAVLLFGGENVLLLRQAGNLRLDSSTGIWTPERLALAHMPYVTQPLPNL